VEEVWDTLERVLDECLAAPVWSQPESTVVEELDRLQVAAQRVAAARLMRIRELDGRGVPAADDDRVLLVTLR